MTGVCRVVDRVARQLLQEGNEVVVLTAQVDHLWPESLDVRGVPVQRFGLDAWSLFGRKPLGQRIANWLEEHPERWDVAVLCDVMEGAELIFRVAEAAERSVLLSFFDSGPESSLAKLLSRWQESPPVTSAGNACRRAAQAWGNQRRWLVSDQEAVQHIRELRPEAQVTHWQLGAATKPMYQPLPQPVDRRALRSALGHACQDVSALADRPWLICPNHGLVGTDSQWLWEFLRRLCERRADVVAWVVGDGPANASLWRRAHEADLERRILFPGCYGDLEDLFCAGDLIVMGQTQWCFPSDEVLAIASGTPCLLAQVAGDRSWGQALHTEQPEQAFGWQLLLPQVMDKWQAAVDSILDHPVEARVWAGQQRQSLLEGLPQSRSLDQFVAVLRQLTEAPCQPQN